MSESFPAGVRRAARQGRHLQTGVYLGSSESVGGELTGRKGGSLGTRGLGPHLSLLQNEPGPDSWKKGRSQPMLPRCWGPASTDEER